MSLTIRALAYAGGKIPGASYIANKFPGVGKAFHGLSRAATMGVGGYFGYQTYAHTYGTGTAAIYAAANIFPATGFPLLFLEGGSRALDAAYNTQRNKRITSFVKNANNDRFGTIQAMKQFSATRLRRDHASTQRVLGNEAMMLHRR